MSDPSRVSPTAKHGAIALAVTIACRTPRTVPEVPLEDRGNVACRGN